MATNLPSCFFIQFLEQLLKFLVNLTLLKYVKSQRSYGFLITKELIFGFQILDLKDHFSASLILSLLIEKPLYLWRPQGFSFQIVSDFIDTFVRFLSLCPGVGLLTPCFVPRREFLYTTIVQGGCPLRVMSRRDAFE